jgi:hypothetical protein
MQSPPPGPSVSLSRGGPLSPSSLVVLHAEVEAEKRERALARAARREAAEAAAQAAARTAILSAEQAAVAAAAAAAAAVAAKSGPRVTFGVGDGETPAAIARPGAAEVAPFQTRKGPRSRCEKWACSHHDAASGLYHEAVGVVRLCSHFLCGCQWQCSDSDSWALSESVLLTATNEGTNVLVALPFCF